MSVWGWKQNAMISIDSTRNVVYNPEYYLMKHLSHFVKPGFYMLKTNSANALSFINPDGKIVIVLENELKTKSVKTIRIDDHQFQIALKPESFNTVVVNL